MSDSSDENAGDIGNSRWQRWRRRNKRQKVTHGQQLNVSDSEENISSSNESPSPHQVEHGQQLQRSEGGRDEDSTRDTLSSNDGVSDQGDNVNMGDFNVDPPAIPLGPPDDEDNGVISDGNSSGGEQEVLAQDPNDSATSDEAEEQDGISDASLESDSDESEGEDHNQDVNNDPLYPDAPLTVNESLIMVLTLAMKHGLTGVCISDILTLIDLHCPPNNKTVKSLYQFKKYFSMIGQSSLLFHHFCTGCNFKLESKDSVCNTCPGVNNSSYFVELPLKKQLQAMLLRPGFYNDLQYRFQRRKRNDHHIEDIYDGLMYKDQFENNGFLSNPNHISFSWYTDGVSIFKSSKFSIWPLYFVINELSCKNRTLKENIVIAGLWFGACKPNPNTFLQPFHSCLAEFKDHGYEMRVVDNAPILLKGFLLGGVADLPAKSLFLRFKQYNGAWGCANCLIQGARHDLGNASVQVYPYSPNINLRNNEDIPLFARQAVELQERDPNASVFGVKGPTLLYYMVPNMVRSTAIDKMHGVDYGVFKLIVSLMFDSSYSNQPFSVSNMVDIFDNRLSKLKPPSFIQRMPRSVKHHLALWKSAEYKLLLMIYSIPLFLGVVDDIYLRHHCHLVSAVYLLNQNSISIEQIDAASRLLHIYVSEFEDLYGLRYLGMNVHQLLHLPQVVKDNGPLWAYACYVYEDLNGKLCKLIHGTRHAAIQVCSSASAYLSIPAMVRSLPEASQARKFCETLSSNVKSVKIADEISPGVYAVGTYSYPGMNDDNATIIALQGLGIQDGQRKYFHRLRKRGVMFYSSTYQRSVQKESSYVQVLNNDDVPELGRIKHFVKWSACGPQCHAICVQCRKMYFVVVEIYERQPWYIHNIPHVRLPYLNKVTPTNNVGVYPVSALQYLCYYLNVDTDEYIVAPVNDLEAD